MKRFLNVASLAVLSFVLILTSCNGEEEEPLNSIGDIYVIKKKVNDEIVYGTAYFLYSNKAINSVSVTTPDGNDFALSAYKGTTLTFSKEPEESDFITEVPSEGNFVFDVATTTGETMKVDETLEFDDLDFPVVTETTFEQDNDSYIIEWGEVDGTDGYFVKLFDEDNEEIYTSQTVGGSILEIEVTTSDGFWQLVPRPGKHYSIHVHAITYESDATFDDFVYNVKEIAIGETEIIWGE